ncbi:MAG: NADP-dependent oxidoreductase [Sphingomonadaceae bacterium]
MVENRFWRLDAHPIGNNFAAALSLQHEPRPEPAPGEVLVRNAWLSMDAGTRMWITPRTDGYQPPLPLGSKMVGLCLGHVVASRDPNYAEGDLVRCFGEWADYTLVDPAASGMTKVDASIADIRQHFGTLGLNALTAWAGLVEVAKVQPGETVLVSAAAGATGSLACQIARNLGCNVIGIAGGPEKCRYLVEELGVRQAIDYKNEDVEAALGAVAGGINAYFDNVGGPMLDAVLPNMTHYGRIAICGLVATYDSDAPTPGPARFDQVLMRRLSIIGFFLPDFLDRATGYLPRLQEWAASGKLVMRFDEFTGLENALSAYAGMLTGHNIGKVIVDVRS